MASPSTSPTAPLPRAAPNIVLQMQRIHSVKNSLAKLRLFLCMARVFVTFLSAVTVYHVAAQMLYISPASIATPPSTHTMHRRFSFWFFSRIFLLKASFAFAWPQAKHL